MCAENILGQLLEEYLAQELIEFNVYCAWGATVRAVDFCGADGLLLQVKNRSNSENSSSSRVRIGTDIEKWFRVDAGTGFYMWDELNTMFDTDVFSEDNFINYVREVLKNNPNALAVEPDSPWLNS